MPEGAYPSLLDPDEQYGKQLREARLELGLSQDGLGKLVGMDGAELARYERGKRRPRLSTRERIERTIRECQEKQLAPLVLTLLDEIIEVEADLQGASVSMPPRWQALVANAHKQAEQIRIGLRKPPLRSRYARTS